MSIKFQQMLPTELQQYSRTFPPQIVLTEIEQIVFNALPRARMIYCCGGWVRDKLIQVESDDLDMVVLAFEGGYPLFAAEFKNNLKAILKSLRIEHKAAGVRKTLNMKKDSHNHMEFGAAKGTDLLQMEFEMVTYTENRKFTEFLKVDFKFFENRAMENISTALEHDLKTRDFKVNSLYFDPNSGYIIFHTIDVGFV